MRRLMVLRRRLFFIPELAAEARAFTDMSRSSLGYPRLTSSRFFNVCKFLAVIRSVLCPGLVRHRAVPRLHSEQIMTAVLRFASARQSVPVCMRMVYPKSASADDNCFHKKLSFAWCPLVGRRLVGMQLVGMQILIPGNSV